MDDFSDVKADGEGRFGSEKGRHFSPFWYGKGLVGKGGCSGFSTSSTSGWRVEEKSSLMLTRQRKFWLMGSLLHDGTAGQQCSQSKVKCPLCKGRGRVCFHALITTRQPWNLTMLLGSVTYVRQCFEKRINMDENHLGGRRRKMNSDRNKPILIFLHFQTYFQHVHSG